MKNTLLLLLSLLACTMVFSQVNMGLLYQQSYNEDMSDVWGFVWSGTEYAIVTTRSEVEIFDLTDPSNPGSVLHLEGLISSTWRDAKFWDGFVYVTNESGDGIQVIDIRNLPGPLSSADVSYIYPGGMQTAHNIFIDENGIAYVCGTNHNDTKILDLTVDPADPPLVGIYDAAYVHDLFVRGDTMWTAEIYAGRVSVVDVSDKSAPTIMAMQPTPGDFTHNTWLNDAGDVLFSTDEVNGAAVVAYDVSDITDIKVLDEYRSSPGMNVMLHNTHVLGDFLFTSYYKDGVTVCDISRPNTIVEVASYDTNPLDGSGYEGCWGVYPYLPSGIVLVTDDYEGFFVLGASYQHAAFIEGTVTDMITGLPIANAQIENVGNAFSSTNLLGFYEEGTAIDGTYDFEVSAPGYFPMSVTGVVLTSSELVIQDFALQPILETELEIKLLLQGPYLGGGKMSLALNELALLPEKPPYESVPWSYTGPESLSVFPQDMVDWVLVELRQSAIPYDLVEQQVGLLLETGEVKSLDGISNLSFPNVGQGQYKIAVRHRSHLDILSAEDFLLPAPVSVNFIADGASALGPDAMALLSDGSWALHAADLNAKGVVSYEDFNLYLADASSIYFYLAADLDFDGLVTVLDYNLYKRNFDKLIIPELRY